MRIVVDTNILLTFFWDNSVLRRVCRDKKAEFFTAEYALGEIKKHKEVIAKRAGLNSKEASDALKQLFSSVTVIDTKDYDEFLQEVRDSTSEFSTKDRTEFSKDIDFLAVSLMLCCPLWSNDKLLSKQKKVMVFNTKEIVSILDI
jgi:predicted nucleic acid-binding protein